MPAKPPSRQAPTAPTDTDKPSLLRWVRNALGRPAQLEQGHDRVAVAPVDPRPETDEQPTSLPVRQRVELGAKARAAREALEARWDVPQVPEVSDTNFDEYEQTERSWAGTVPGELDTSRTDRT